MFYSAESSELIRGGMCGVIRFPMLTEHFFCALLSCSLELSYSPPSFVVFLGFGYNLYLLSKFPFWHRPQAPTVPFFSSFDPIKV